MSIDEEEQYQCEDGEVCEEEEAYEEKSDDGEAQSEEDTTATQSGDVRIGPYNATEVNDMISDELALPQALVADCQRVWQTFLAGSESLEAVGEAIYSALFDAAPSLQPLFKTPRALMAMRFSAGLNTIVSCLGKPGELANQVEMLGFQHLDLDVTVPRVVVFRDAIVDLLGVELGAHFTPQIHAGFCTLLNYAGGSFIFIRKQFSQRLKVIASSWTAANKKAVGNALHDPDGEESVLTTSDELQARVMEVAAPLKKTSSKQRVVSMSFGLRSTRRKNASGEVSTNAGVNQGGKSGSDFTNTSVPQTFDAMFSFNVVVMGMHGRNWLGEILASFDAIVNNISNSHRLQEECDVLSLRLAKYRGTIKLIDFKSVMLASLRSLCKDWGSDHEVAWTWLWSNVERLLHSSIGKPQKQQVVLEHFMRGLDGDKQHIIRREVYIKFFALVPSGQDHFKQSSTRLHFIVDKIMVMTQDMYKSPKNMVNDISALGLRHVGYGIPTALFGPFVTACVEVVRPLTDDMAAVEAFRWSLGLISRILVRVIGEGSTIVMRAINSNSSKLLKRAVECAPRGERAMWVLNVQVGTQSISPFMLAIKHGSLDAAEGILQDLLTIRADRDRYYYGLDLLFQRHDDIVKCLCQDAPALLPTLLGGMIWRSRTTENGFRRTNYYVKHLIVHQDGSFARTTEWITEFQDPKTVCHAVIALVMDTVWQKLVLRRFLLSKAWFIFTLAVFVTAQCLLVQGAVRSRALGPQLSLDILVALRIFIYMCSMPLQVRRHMLCIIKAIRKKDYVKCKGLPLPAYLHSWQEATGLALTLCLLSMLCTEPILHCIQEGTARRFAIICKATDGGLLTFYSMLSCFGTVLYFLLLTELSVLSTRVSAFTLICQRVSKELALSLGALVFATMGFAFAACALDQSDPNFSDLPMSTFHFFEICLRMVSGDVFEAMEEHPMLMIVTFVYMIVAVVFFLNLLIAQLVCAYQATFFDMEGHARLNRGKIMTEIMRQVPDSHWAAFVESMRFDVPVEFGEGDIGLPGAVQASEPASANSITTDPIRRYGGTTLASAPWPQDEGAGGHESEQDKFERLEKLIQRSMKRMTRHKGSGMGSSNGSSFSGYSGSASIRGESKSEM